MDRPEMMRKFSIFKKINNCWLMRLARIVLKSGEKKDLQHKLLGNILKSKELLERTIGKGYVDRC
jgi:hypothetical protein